MNSLLFRGFRAFITFIVLFALLLLLILFVFVDSQPKTTDIQPLDTFSAHKSKQLLLKFKRIIVQRNDSQIVEVSADELSGLLSLIHRVIPQLVINYQLSSSKIQLNFSLALPYSWRGQLLHLNASAIVLPSNQGLKLGDVSLGAMHMNGQWLLGCLVWLVDSYTGDDSVKKAANIIRVSHINSERMYLSAHFNNDDLQSINENSLIMIMRDYLSPLRDQNRAQYYLDVITSYARSQYTTDKQMSDSGIDEQSSIDYSLSKFISMVFTQAQNYTKNNASSPKVENKAALVALALYFGDDRFKWVVGDLNPFSKQDSNIRERLKSKVSLYNRADLQKHFIYSMALQLFSTHYASDALGEYKELLDSNTGGSGFSFADLQADRAGTRLAMVATHSDKSAMNAQKLLSTVQEVAFIPSIEGLEEGVSHIIFNQQYIHVNTVEYLDAVRQIDNRLAMLPLYQIKDVTLF